MSLRRLAENQPANFAFGAENAAWCQEQMKKYPPGRQSSAVIPILWRAQEQEGWVTAVWKQTENNRRAKFYSLTRLGRRQLESEAANWQRLSTAISQIIQLSET